MRKSRFTGQQIVMALRQAEAGTAVVEGCAAMGVHGRSRRLRRPCIQPPALQTNECATDPWQKVLEIALSFFQERDQEFVSLLRIHMDLPAVQSQEDVRGEKSHALVAVDEGVIHEQRLEQCSRHLSDVSIVARTGAEQSALEQAKISDTRGAPECLEKTLVDSEHLIQAQVQDAITPQGGDPTPRFRRRKNPGGAERQGGRACG